MLLSREKIRVEKDEGFTLIELIIVIVMVGIISGGLVPSYLQMTRRAKKKVCGMNCLKLGDMYELHLCECEKEHSTIMFGQYIEEQDQEICPESGMVVYEGGKVRCSAHPLDDGEDEVEDEGDVPYL